MFVEKIIGNIRRIMVDRNLTQATMAEYVGTSPSQFSKILSQDVQLSLKQLSNLAINLSMREIDVITYPERYVSESETPNSGAMETEAILQVRLKKDKRDQVLRLVFGDNDIEILNR